jgi:DNA polymerase sigma
MNSKYDREENYPWISDETLRIKDIHAYLHNEILDYVKWIEPSEEDKSTRINLVKTIKKIVKESYPEAVVMVFGSCAT